MFSYVCMCVCMCVILVLRSIPSPSCYIFLLFYLCFLRWSFAKKPKLALNLNSSRLLCLSSVETVALCSGAWLNECLIPLTFLISTYRTSLCLVWS